MGIRRTYFRFKPPGSPWGSRALYIVFMLSIDSSQYLVIFNHVTVFLVFIGKSKVWPSMWILSTYILRNCQWFAIKLCGISIILLTDLLYRITFFYYSIDLRFVCIFNRRGGGDLITETNHPRISVIRARHPIHYGSIRLRIYDIRINLWCVSGVSAALTVTCNIFHIRSASSGTPLYGYSDYLCVNL